MSTSDPQIHRATDADAGRPPAASVRRARACRRRPPPSFLRRRIAPWKRLQSRPTASLAPLMLPAPMRMLPAPEPITTEAQPVSPPALRSTELVTASEVVEPETGPETAFEDGLKEAVSTEPAAGRSASSCRGEMIRRHETLTLEDALAGPLDDATEDDATDDENETEAPPDDSAPDGSAPETITPKRIESEPAASSSEAVPEPVGQIEPDAPAPPEASVKEPIAKDLSEPREAEARKPEPRAAEKPQPGAARQERPAPRETRRKRARLFTLPRLRMADALVASFVLVAAAAPLLAPLTRDFNPFIRQISVRAERSVVILPDDAPTLWAGLRQARAVRDVTPAWADAMLHDGRPLNVGLALTTPPHVVEVDPAPLPAIALIGRGGDGALATSPGLAISLDEDELLAMQKAALNAAQPGEHDGEQNAWTEIETASIPSEGDDALFAPQGQTAPPSLSPRPSGRPEIDPLSAPAASYPALAETDLAETDLAETDVETEIGAPIETAYAAEARSKAPLVDEAAARGGDARVSIVLTAVGLNEAASQAALYTLPPEVAVAVAPVGDRPADWARAAHQSGRVVLVEVPMEPAAYPRLNPGPLTLLTNSTAEENRKRLDAALAEMPDIDGVSTYLGDRFKTDRAALAPMLKDLKQRGLYIFENDRKPSSALGAAAKEAGVSAFASTVSLDNGGRRRDISEGLEKLEAEARRTGSAIGVAVAMPSTVKAIADWLETAEGRGMRLTQLHHP